MNVVVTCCLRTPCILYFALIYTLCLVTNQGDVYSYTMLDLLQMIYSAIYKIMHEIVNDKI